MGRHMAIAGLGVLMLSACDQGVDEAPERMHLDLMASACDVAVTPLAMNEASSLGFSGVDVLALATERFEAVHVLWQEGADPAEETLSFSFGAPIAASEHQLAANVDCSETTWVDVEVPVTVTSASGLVSADGIVHLRGYDEGGEAAVFLRSKSGIDLELQASIAGPYLATAYAPEWASEHAPPGFHDGLTSAHLVLRPTMDPDVPRVQRIGIGARYEFETTHSSASLYRCEDAVSVLDASQ